MGLKGLAIFGVQEKEHGIELLLIIENRNFSHLPIRGLIKGLKTEYQFFWKNVPLSYC